METRPAIVGNQKTYVELLQRLKPALGQLKPDEQSVERFLQLCRRIAQRNPDILQCTVASLENALKDSAALGLDPTGLMGFGHIVAFKNKRGDKEATFIPGAYGLVDMYYRTKKIAGIKFKLIHQTDEWQYEEGLTPILRHTPRYTGTFEYGKRHECVAGYVTWWDVIDGKPIVQQHLWMWFDELERVRKLSKQTPKDGESTFGSWFEHWGPMACKSLLRMARKTMPLTPEVSEQLDYALGKEDEKMGISDPFIDITPGEPETPEDGRTKIGGEKDDS